MDEVLAFWFGHKRLELRCREGVDETGLGDDEKEDLGAGKDRQLVGLRDCVSDVLWTRRVLVSSHLLHDSRLALGEGDVTTRLVLDELDFNLPPLAARLVVVIVVVVGSSAGARTLDASALGGAVAVLEVVVLVVRSVGVVGDNLAHGEFSPLFCFG